MADYNDIKQSIATNLPDNNKREITAARLRDTLNGFVDKVETTETGIEQKCEVLTNIDDEPTAGSNNLVKSGGVYGDTHKTVTETEQSTNLGGFWRYDTNAWISDNARNCLIIPYNSNKNYKIDTHIRATPIAGIIYTSVQPTPGVELTDVLGYELVGTGSDQYISNYTPNIPANTAYIIVQSTDRVSAATVTIEYVSSDYKFYTTEETDQKIQDIESKIPEVLDNLNSTSESNALSAAQGKLLGDNLFEDKLIAEPVSVIIKTDDGINGRWRSDDGRWVTDNTRRSTEKIDVVEGEKYLITTDISGSTIIGYLVQWNGDTFIGNASAFNGGSGNAVDREYIVPQGVTKIALTSYDATSPSLKKVVTVKEPLYYTKTAVDNLISNGGKYGVRWSISDVNDLGERCFSSIGLNATIGIGNVSGSSDFDNIYPWSEIKRCNVRTNENGAKIVTFEGETGFTLDGSNGDVFVRIPKFCFEKYVKDGYQYVTVSRNDGYVHPAFVEDGKEVDEIFIGAFEGDIENNILHSRSGKMPANNEVPQTFLDAAKINGVGYSLYDMRSVDALWVLISVEFGCRNTNNIFGYGLSDFWQGVKVAKGTCIEAATNTHSIKVPYWNSAYKLFIPVGSNALICSNEQENIIKYGKITSIVDAPDNSYTIFTFDGDAFDVDTNCFIGTAPYDTNLCETAAVQPLTYHTGRALNVTGSGDVNITRNPIRYRWIENIFGNVWHLLPDITFVDRQMYVCNSIKDYEFFKHTDKYRPVCPILTLQVDNGNKADVVGSNYWITEMLNDVFIKGVSFGKTFSTDLTSKEAFGGYYYLNNGIVCIANGGGFDHLYRCNILTQRAWISSTTKWYLYGARLMYKNI